MHQDGSAVVIGVAQDGRRVRIPLEGPTPPDAYGLNQFLRASLASGGTILWAAMRTGLYRIDTSALSVRAR